MPLYARVADDNVGCVTSELARPEPLRTVGYVWRTLYTTLFLMPWHPRSLRLQTPSCKPKKEQRQQLLIENRLIYEETIFGC